MSDTTVHDPKLFVLLHLNWIFMKIPVLQYIENVWSKRGIYCFMDHCECPYSPSDGQVVIWTRDRSVCEQPHMVTPRHIERSSQEVFFQFAPHLSYLVYSRSWLYEIIKCEIEIQSKSRNSSLDNKQMVINCSLKQVNKKSTQDSQLLIIIGSVAFNTILFICNSIIILFCSYFLFHYSQS